MISEQIMNYLESNKRSSLLIETLDCCKSYTKLYLGVKVLASNAFIIKAELTKRKKDWIHSICLKSIEKDQQ